MEKSKTKPKLTMKITPPAGIYSSVVSEYLNMVSHPASEIVRRAGSLEITMLRGGIYVGDFCVAMKFRDTSTTKQTIVVTMRHINSPVIHDFRNQILRSLDVREIVRFYGDIPGKDSLIATPRAAIMQTAQDILLEAISAYADRGNATIGRICSCAKSLMDINFKVSRLTPTWYEFIKLVRDVASDVDSPANARRMAVLVNNVKDSKSIVSLLTKFESCDTGKPKVAFSKSEKAEIKERAKSISTHTTAASNPMSVLDNCVVAKEEKDTEKPFSITDAVAASVADSENEPKQPTLNLIGEFEDEGVKEEEPIVYATIVRPAPETEPEVEPEDESEELETTNLNPTPVDFSLQSCPTDNLNPIGVCKVVEPEASEPYSKEELEILADAIKVPEVEPTMEAEMCTVQEEVTMAAAAECYQNSDPKNLTPSDLMVLIVLRELMKRGDVDNIAYTSSQQKAWAVHTDSATFANANLESLYAVMQANIRTIRPIIEEFMTINQTMQELATQANVYNGAGQIDLTPFSDYSIATTSSGIDVSLTIGGINIFWTSSSATELVPEDIKASLATLQAAFQS